GMAPADRQRPPRRGDGVTVAADQREEQRCHRGIPQCRQTAAGGPSRPGSSSSRRRTRHDRTRAASRGVRRRRGLPRGQSGCDSPLPVPSGLPGNDRRGRATAAESFAQLVLLRLAGCRQDLQGPVMGLLYPRLLAERAGELHEEYRRLPIAELRQRATTSHPSAVFVATGGERVRETKLTELRELILRCAADAGFPTESNRHLRAVFDLEAARILHSTMQLDPAEAASRDVWAFLALVLLPDVAYWRYPKPPGERVLGIDLTRHVFGRLWWRAHLVYSPGTDDPY